MSRGHRVPDSGVDRAALAFSLLPVRFADEANEHLSVAERQRLREGLARIREASDYTRVKAVRDGAAPRLVRRYRAPTT